MERFRIAEGASVYFVTYSVVDWLPVFISGPACQIITDSLNFCHDQKNLRINAFVIMPTHIHAIVFDEDFDNDRLQRTLNDMRKFTGRELSNFCCKHLSTAFSTTLERAAKSDRKHRFWQPSRHPVGITTEKFWRQKFDYLHANPARKGLVHCDRDWRFSSARFYDDSPDSESDLQLSPIRW